nr:hypothetical protein [Tanacetum cinerariifolium]
MREIVLLTRLEDRLQFSGGDQEDLGAVAARSANSAAACNILKLHVPILPHFHPLGSGRIAWNDDDDLIDVLGLDSRELPAARLVTSEPLAARLATSEPPAPRWPGADIF